MRIELRDNPSERLLVLDLPTQEGWKAELTWVELSSLTPGAIDYRLETQLILSDY